MVKKLDIVTNDMFLNSLSTLLKKHIYKFFNIVTLSEELEMIEWSQILKRIVMVKYNEKYIISIFENSNEKD